MRQTRADFFFVCDSAPVPFVGAKGTKSAFCARVLSGPVLGASCAENLKIRPEFLPVVIHNVVNSNPSYTKLWKSHGF